MKEMACKVLIVWVTLILIIGNCGCSSSSKSKKESPPGAPQGLTSAAGDGMALLSWSPVTGAQGYKVYMKEDPQASYALKTETVKPSCAVSGLTNGVGYYFTVTAVNQAGESGFSNEAIVKPEPLQPRITVKQGAGVISSGGEYAFGEVLLSFSSSEIVFTVENSGEGNLFFTGTLAVNLTGPDASDFSVTQQPSSLTVPPGGAVQFTLTFTPQTFGEKSATVEIMTNDSANNEYTFSVTGNTGGNGPGAISHIFRQGSSTYYYNSPTLVGGCIYIGTSRKLYDNPAPDNYFFKLDHTLNKIWEHPLGDKEVRGGATLDSQGNVYFVVETGRSGGYAGGVRDFLYSLDPHGNFRWEREITAAGMPHIVGMYNPAVSEGPQEKIYVGGGKLYAFDPQGNEVWSYVEAGATQMDIKNAPIIDPAGNIYFTGYPIGMGMGTIRLYSLDPDGKERWVFDTGNGQDEYFSSPAFSVDQTRIIAPAVQTIYCLDAATGAKHWQFTPPGISGAFRATPAVDQQDNIYIGTKAFGSSSFYAIKSGGSGLLWRNDLGADLYSSPLLGNDGAVYVGSELTTAGNRFHALDRETGAVKWSIPMQLDITWSSAALSGEGLLYIGSMDGYVYAIQCEATGFLSGAGSPRFHGSNASTGRRAD